MKNIRRAYSNYKVKLGFIHIEIFIATMAMFFTGNQAFLMSQQNKSIVMPWVDIKISTSDKKSLIKIENSGIGPAILHGMKVIDLGTGNEIINISEFENKLRKSWEDQTEHQLKISSRIFEENQDSPEIKEIHENIVKNIEQNKENYRASLKQCSDINPQSALRIGDSIELISVGSLTGISKNMPFDLSVCYCSVYKDCWVSKFPFGKIEVKNCNDYKFENSIKCDY